jgi:hypothetical protein
LVERKSGLLSNRRWACDWGKGVMKQLLIDSLKSMEWLWMMDELEWMWKEAVVTYYVTIPVFTWKNWSKPRRTVRITGPHAEFRSNDGKLSFISHATLGVLNPRPPGCMQPVNMFCASRVHSCNTVYPCMIKNIEHLSENMLC